LKKKQLALQKAKENLAELQELLEQLKKDYDAKLIKKEELRKKV
jgi:hypothetical protein